MSTNLFLFWGAKKLDFNLYCPTIYVPPKYKRGFRNEGRIKKTGVEGKSNSIDDLQRLIERIKEFGRNAK